MAISIAQLIVRLNADTTGMEAGFARASKMLGPTGPLGMPLLLATAAVAGIGIASLKMAGDFQKGITTLVTGAGESRKNIQLVSDGILQLARDTGTSTKQLTDGMFMIESAGFHGADGLAVLKAAAEGAKVGNADLGTTADAVTTIMNDYHLKANQAALATNILIATVANGKTHMEDLAGSISHVLPVASAYGLKLSDVSAALATMTASGVPAADAATYLRQTIIGLGSPTSAAAAALRSIGLTTDEVNASMKKSLPATLQMITEALGKKFKVGSVEYNEALKAISGGSKQMQGMLDLTGQHLNTFIADAANIGGVAKKGGSSIAGWADVQKTMNFQFDRAKEVVMTLMISLGEKLLPVATKLFAFIADNAIPALQHFSSWVSGSSTSAQIFKVVMIAVAGAIAAVLVTAFISWAIAAGAAAVATIAATWPILLIGAGIALLVVGIKIAIDHWKQITTALGHFKDMILGAPAPIKILAAILLLPIAPILLIIGAVILLKTHWTQVVAFLGAAWHGFVGVVQAVGGAIRSAFKGFVNGIIFDINALIRFIDKLQIHVPSIKVGPVKTPSFDWNGLNISQIPYLAEGGIITQAGEVMVGERGPERLMLPAGAAVVPLPSGARGGGNGNGGAPQEQTIIVQLDGRVLTQSVIKNAPHLVRLTTGARSF